jgi:hypothetical protein
MALPVDLKGQDYFRDPTRKRVAGKQVKNR